MLLLAGMNLASATDDAQNAKMADWQNCVSEAALKLDDGKSDALSIAYGIEPACALKYRAWMSPITSLATTAGEGQYAQQVSSDEEIKLLTNMVLQLRAARSRRSTIETAFEAYQKKDFRTEIRLIRPLADEGVAAAEYLLALDYIGGEGVVQDMSKGAELLQAAAKQGLPDAQNLLGLDYELGVGVPKDRVQAYVWYARSAAGGMDSALRDRDRLAASLTAEEIATAQEQAGEPVAMPSTDCAPQDRNLAQLALKNGYQFNSACH